MMERYGLLGRRLAHSFSRGYFTQRFRKEGRAAEYLNFELEAISELPALLQQNRGLRGLNVTIPYKESVLPLLHGADATVEAIGACNCIRIEDGKLYGYNTDVAGFRTALTEVWKGAPAPALVLGTGGASKAVGYVLRMLGFPCQLVSRSRSASGVLTYAEITPELLRAHPLVVNTTPLGMFPSTGASPELPYAAAGSGHLFFDLIYNPEVTEFMRLAAAAGARTANGHRMLVVQAEESWTIWQGKK